MSRTDNNIPVQTIGKKAQEGGYITRQDVIDSHDEIGEIAVDIMLSKIRKNTFFGTPNELLTNRLNDREIDDE